MRETGPAQKSQENEINQNILFVFAKNFQRAKVLRKPGSQGRRFHFRAVSRVEKIASSFVIACDDANITSGQNLDDQGLMTPLVVANWSLTIRGVIWWPPPVVKTIYGLRWDGQETSEEWPPRWSRFCVFGFLSSPFMAQHIDIDGVRSWQATQTLHLLLLHTHSDTDTRAHTSTQRDTGFLCTRKTTSHHPGHGGWGVSGKNGSRRRGAEGWAYHSRRWSGDWENRGRDQRGKCQLLRPPERCHHPWMGGDELQRGCAQHLRSLASYSWRPSTVSQKRARCKPQQQVESICQRLAVAFSQTTRLGLFGRMHFAKRCWSFNDVQAESVASWMAWRMLHQTTHVQDYCKPAAGWIPRQPRCRRPGVQMQCDTGAVVLFMLR